MAWSYTAASGLYVQTRIHRYEADGTLPLTGADQVEFTMLERYHYLRAVNLCHFKALKEDGTVLDMLLDLKQMLQGLAALSAAFDQVSARARLDRWLYSAGTQTSPTVGVGLDVWMTLDAPTATATTTALRLVHWEIPVTGEQPLQVYVDLAQLHVAMGVLQTGAAD